MEVSTPEGAVVILDVGDVKPRAGGGQQAAGVGDDATLAALGLLVRVKARWTAASRGLDRPAVSMPAIALHRRTRRKVLRQHHQGAAALTKPHTSDRRWSACYCRVRYSFHFFHFADRFHFAIDEVAIGLHAKGKGESRRSPPSAVRPETGFNRLRRP